MVHKLPIKGNNFTLFSQRLKDNASCCKHVASALGTLKHSVHYVTLEADRGPSNGHPQDPCPSGSRWACPAVGLSSHNHDHTGIERKPGQALSNLVFPPVVVASALLFEVRTLCTLGEAKCRHSLQCFSAWLIREHSALLFSVIWGTQACTSLHLPNLYKDFNDEDIQ